MERVKQLMRNIRQTGEKAYIEDAINFYLEIVDKMWKVATAGTVCALKNMTSNTIEDIINAESDMVDFVCDDLEELGSNYIQASEMIRFITQVIKNPSRYEAYTKEVEDKIIYCIYDKEKGILSHKSNNTLYT